MIFFDIDDTLLDNREAEISAAKEFYSNFKNIFPMSSDDFTHNWRLVTEKHVQRYLSGELSFQGQRRERLKEIFSHNCVLSDEEADRLFRRYLGFYENHWKLFPDAEDCLDQLKQNRLGIISNGYPVQQRKKLTDTGIIDRFSVVIISGDVDAKKPDPKIFMKACRQAGAEPEDCWHVGDNQEADYKGSLAAGMNAIWLNRNNSASDRGIKSIKSLSELKDIIGIRDFQES